MQTRERQTGKIEKYMEYVHQLLHLQWCHDHPVACIFLTMVALAVIGVVVIAFR